MTIDGTTYASAADAAVDLYPEWREWCDTPIVRQMGWEQETLAAMWTAGLIDDEHIRDWTPLVEALLVYHENEPERRHAREERVRCGD